MAFLTPNSKGELDTLKTYGLQQLAQVRSTAYGLTTEQMHSTPSASGLSIGQLLVHTVEVAIMWVNLAAVGGKAEFYPEQWGRQHSMEECTELAAEHSAEEVLAEFDRRVEWVARRYDDIKDLDQLVPVPDMPWFPPELTHWETRWVLNHVVAEIARHAGHADVIRESIDGKGAYELNARADGQLADDQEFRIPGA